MKEKEEEGRRRKKTKKKKRSKKTENPKKNKKIYKNGARTEAPQPSKKDTHGGGVVSPSFLVFKGWARNHYKTCALRTTPEDFWEEHPQKRPLHQNSQNPQRRLPKYPSVFSHDALPWAPILILCSKGPKNGAQLSTLDLTKRVSMKQAPVGRNLYIYIYIYTYIHTYIHISISIYLSIYIAIEPITSFDGPRLGFKKSRGRGKDEKLRQEKARWERRQNIETWKTPTPSVGVFLGHFLLWNWGKFEILTFFWPTDWGYGHWFMYVYVHVYLCMCTYINRYIPES